MPLPTLKNQKGAMFGIDGRVALVIFGALSTVVGAYLLVNVGIIRGQAFSSELDGVKNAIEGIHQDLRQDLYATLTTANATNAMTALFDDSVLTATYQPKWLGPYVEYRATTHPLYGAMAIEKMLSDHTTACGSPCYYWLTYASVPTNTVEEINDSIDGTEGSPNTSGQVQWDTPAASSHKLWFRISRTL